MQYIGVEEWAKASVEAEKLYLSHPPEKKNNSTKGYFKINSVHIVGNNKDMECLYELASAKVTIALWVIFIMHGS
eukprot:12080856-Ditylum_brightwellii.AAC.1